MYNAQVYHVAVRQVAKGEGIIFRFWETAHHPLS